MIWFLVSHYKWGKKKVFYGFISDNLEFPLVKSSKIFTAHQILPDTNFKHKKGGFVNAGFSIFANYLSFTIAKKLVL